MIPDLRYPEDARKVIEALHSGLEYDAAIAVLGIHCSAAPLPRDGPDLTVEIRYGGTDTDKTVRKEAQALLPRFSLISMVSRFEVHARLLLLQRRVLEELSNSGKKMTSERMWAILKGVNRDIREGLVNVCSKLIVEHPSPALLSRMDWLLGIYRVRNCLAHRLGKVEMVDVKAPGTSIRGVQEGDRLRATWLRLMASEGDKEIQSFPHEVHGPTEIQIKFEEYKREWAIGEQILVSAAECQFLAMSLSLLGIQLLAEFERELNALLQIRQ